MQVVSVRLAPFGHGETVFAGELLFGNLHHPALRPFVKQTMLEEVRVPAFYAGDFFPLREMP